MSITKQLVVLLSVGLTGCATHWYNPNISSYEAHERQKTIDTSQCTLYAHGAAPMPEVRAYQDPNQSYDFNASVSTYGSNGYGRSHISGRVHQTPNPAASFSSGFSNGAAMGQAIAARKARKLAFTGCMYQLGWTDSKPEGFSLSDTSAVADPSPRSSKSAGSSGSVVPAYKLTKKDEWEAEFLEFLEIYDQYESSKAAQDAFFGAVVRISEEQPGFTGHQVFLAAHQDLNYPPKTPKNDVVRIAYDGATSGDAMSQYVLANMHLIGVLDQKNVERALYWCTRSAQAGYPDALAMLSAFYIDGVKVDRDYVAAYRLVSKASAAGSELGATMLAKLSKRLTPEELAEVKEKALRP